MPDAGPVLTPELLLEHRDFLRALARGLLGDEHEAEDVVQDAFAATLERPPAGVASARSWLAQVVHHLALNRRRGHARRARREGDAARPEAVPSSAEVLARLDVQERVVHAVTALPEPYRTTIYLRFYEGLPPREVARRTGAPIETVRSRCRRGLARLRGELDDGRGGREAWSAALLPLAGLKRGAELGAPAAPVVPLAAAAVALALGLGAAWWTLRATGAVARTPDPVLFAGFEALAPAPLDEARAARAHPALREAIPAAAPARHATSTVLATGRALDARTGEALPELLVRAGGLMTRTDGEGRFALELPVGAVRDELAFAEGPGAAPLLALRTGASPDAAQDGARDWRVAVGPTYALDLDLPAELAGAPLACELQVDAATALAAEVRGGAAPWVRFPPPPALTLTGGAGRSRYVLRARDAAGAWRASADVHALPGVYPEPVQLRFERAAALAGTVLDAHGRPLAGATVELAPADDAPRVEATADERGRFALAGLAPGPRTLVARARGHADARAEVTLRAGETTAAEPRLDAVPTARLSGVLASRSGRHAPVGPVLVRGDGFERALAPTLDPGTGAWTFALDDAPLGELELVPPMGDGFAWDPPVRVVRAPDDAVRFTCLDDGPALDLRVRAFDARTGARLERVRVAVLVDRYDLGYQAAVALQRPFAPRVVEHDGLALRGVPPGAEVHWLVERDGYRAQRGYARDLVRADGALAIEARLEPAWRVDLWVAGEEADGRLVPLAGARVLTSAGRELGRTLADGRVVLELAYDPGRLDVALDGWRLRALEGFSHGKRREELPLHRVLMERR